MQKETETYLALGVASSSYAMALNTDLGKSFARQHTWASVVLGTSLVLSMLRFILPKEYWQKVVIAFIVAGIPMIVRSLFNQLADESE